MTKGDRIKQLREMIGMTQSELAEKSNTTKQSIYKYEQNIVTNIPSDRIEDIAKALGTTPQAIMGWDVPEELSISLTTKEQKLIDNYRSLNDEGQQTVCNLVEGLIISGKYKKSAPNGLGQKEA